MKEVLIIIFSFTLLNTNILCQMERAEYSFCIVDSVIYKENKLVVDENNKPDNFISTQESWFISHIGLEIIDSAIEFELTDSSTVEVSLKTSNHEIESSIQQMNKIHKTTNSRAFVAGYTNNSNDTLSFPIQDASLIAIIEAKNNLGKWRPIQFWPISGCGNSYYSPRLLPGKTILFTVDNNFGTENTVLRLRLHGNDTIYISNEFRGTVNQSVFDKSKNFPKDFGYILCDSIFYLEKPLFKDFEFSMDREIHFEEVE